MLMAVPTACAPPATAILMARGGLFSAVLLTFASSILLTSDCQNTAGSAQSPTGGRHAVCQVLFLASIITGEAHTKSLGSNTPSLAVVGPQKEPYPGPHAERNVGPQPYAGLYCNVESILALASVSALPADPPSDGTQIRGKRSRFP